LHTLSHTHTVASTQTIRENKKERKIPGGEGKPFKAISLFLGKNIAEVA
jgi:hypothetical protein